MSNPASTDIEAIVPPWRARRPANSRAYAIGFLTRKGFHVRRIVWGRALARAEKRRGEQIRRAMILVEQPPHSVRPALCALIARDAGWPEIAKEWRR
jgi:hypothetical protein